MKKVILLAPALIFFSLFTVWPLWEVIWLSFFKTNFITTTFVGINNYITVLQDKAFIQSIINSLFYSILLIVGHVGLSLACSLLIFKLNKKWQDVSRILFYIPVLSSGIIIVQVWKWLFSVNGFFNWLLSFIHIEAISWFSQGLTGIPTVGFIVVISSFGANVIIIMSSLLDIDKGLIESATIDGANTRQVNWHIIIPTILPTIKTIALLSMVAAFQIYETISMLCPYVHTSTMSYFIYEQAFKFSKYGLASVEAIFLLVIIMVLLTVQKKVSSDEM